MAKSDCSELAKNITDIAMNIGSREGVKSLDDVVLKMQEHFPEIRRADIVDAIVEATRGREKQSDELADRLNDIKKEARLDKNINKKIKEIQGFLDTGTIPKKDIRANAKQPDAIEKLRELKYELSMKLSKSEPARQEKIKKQIEFLENKIATGDIQPKLKATDIPLSKDLERLQYQRDRLRLEVKREIDNLKPRTIWEKIAEPFNTARALITGGEMSLVLRQGAPYMLSHPVKGIKAMRDMFKAFVSEESSAKINNALFNRDNAPLYARSKLYLAPVEGGAKMSQMEEAFMAKAIGKIPLLKNFQRAGLTFLNTIRADGFDTLAKTIGRNGEVTQIEAEAIANYMNVSTGRGNLYAMERAAVQLNTVFFAPKYVASRFEMIALQPLYHGTSRTRIAIAKEYGRYLIGLSTIYALGKLAGGVIEDDSKSTDFGKMRFGNTRLDPLSGLAQAITFTSQIVSGKKKKLSGKTVDIRGDNVPYGGENSWDIIARFFRGKLSPMIGTPVDIATGKDIVGNEVTAKSVATNLTIPITYRDIYKAMIEQGVPRGAALSALAFFGMGLQTIPDRSGKKRTSRQMRKKRSSE